MLLMRWASSSMLRTCSATSSNVIERLGYYRDVAGAAEPGISGICGRGGRTSTDQTYFPTSDINVKWVLSRSTTTHQWWPQGCCLERSFTKSGEKNRPDTKWRDRYSASALRSRGQCAFESPMSWLRVARTCPQSAARRTGRAIERVVEGWPRPDGVAIESFENRNNPQQLYLWHNRNSY